MERYRTTILMLAALLVLVAVAFFLNNRAAPTDDASATPVAEQYVWQETGLLTQLEVVSNTQRTALRQEGDTGVWDIVAPEEALADGFVLRSVAESLTNLLATTMLTETSDLSQFQLDDPQLTVTAVFSATTPVTRTLQIGSATFDGAGYYVKTPDKPSVYVVSNSVIEPLRSWPSTPPKAQPTATPLPMTVVPTSEAITGTITSTLTVATASVPPLATITNSTTITSTNPGAANPTTPLASPALPTTTISP